MANESGQDVLLRPYYLDGVAGRLFCQEFYPRENVLGDSCCLILPPFAEEMNKSRRMLALQARRLAAAGIVTVIPDFYGTGDSDGEFADATVAIWQADAERLFSHLQESGFHSVSLIALRMGALLCESFVAQMPPGLKAGARVFWQPTVSGKALVREFLRLRVAADMANGRRTSVASLLAEAEATGVTEVAGYSLSHELLGGLSELDLKADHPAGATSVCWVEVSQSENLKLRSASQKVIDVWRAQGVSIIDHALSSAAFWASTEIVESPEVLVATTSFLAGGH